jgi:hypothetical protein
MSNYLTYRVYVGLNWIIVKQFALTLFDALLAAEESVSIL